MGWKDDDSIEIVGQMIVVAAFLFAIVLLINARRGLFYASLFWFILMLAATLGVSLVVAHTRRQLAQLREEVLEDEVEEEENHILLEECRRRRERREAIRSSLVQDDGLSDLGREFRANPVPAETAQNLEAKYGMTFGRQNEDIFESEQRDKQIEATWEKKTAADAAWRTVRNGSN